MLFCSLCLTASALPPPRGGRPERLSVHAAPSERPFLAASLQWKRWSFSWPGPRHLHRYTEDAALSAITLIM